MTWRERLADEQLCERAQAGDEASASVLVQRYMRLVGYLARRVFRKGHGLDDAIGVGLEGVADAVRCYRRDGGSTFRAFVAMCIKREFITWTKIGAAPNKRFNETLLHPSRTLEDHVAEHVVPASLSTQTELLSWMRSDCSEFEAGVMEQFLAGRSYKEIGEHYGRTWKQVDNALTRIRKKAHRAAARGELECMGGGWSEPRRKPSQPRPLWSSVDPLHRIAEAGARGQHGTGRHQSPGVVDSTKMCDGLVGRPCG